MVKFNLQPWQVSSHVSILEPSWCLGAVERWEQTERCRRHTKDGNPYGWLALGRGTRGRGFGGQATFIGWKRNVLVTHTGVPYKVYNSVPVVLYLKPFRTTGCTDRD